MEDLKKTYPGAKGGSGVAEWIINHVPETSTFIEAFKGTGVISELLYKNSNIRWIEAIEINPETSKLFQIAGINNTTGDAFSRLYEMIGAYKKLGYNLKDIVVYFDPPYRMDARSHKRKYYKKDYDWDDQKHYAFFRLIDALNNEGVRIIISHYPDPVYNNQFREWYTDEMKTRTRKKTVTEKIWWNFDINSVSDRQRIKRKIERWKDKFEKLTIHERQALLKQLKNKLCD